MWEGVGVRGVERKVEGTSGLHPPLPKGDKEAENKEVFPLPCMLTPTTLPLAGTAFLTGTVNFLSFTLTVLGPATGSGAVDGPGCSTKG